MIDFTNLEKDEKIIGKFMLLLNVIKSKKNKIRLNLQTRNEKVNSEIVIVQLENCLKKLKEDYYKNFNSKTEFINKE